MILQTELPHAGGLVCACFVDGAILACSQDWRSRADHVRSEGPHRFGHLLSYTGRSQSTGLPANRYYVIIWPPNMFVGGEAGVLTPLVASCVLPVRPCLFAAVVLLVLPLLDVVFSVRMCCATRSHLAQGLPSCRGR